MINFDLCGNFGYIQHTHPHAHEHVNTVRMKPLPLFNYFMAEADLIILGILFNKLAPLTNAMLSIDYPQVHGLLPHNP